MGTRIDGSKLAWTVIVAALGLGCATPREQPTGQGGTVAADGSVDWNFDATISTVPYVRNLRDPTAPADCHLLKDHDDHAEIASGMAHSLPANPNAMVPFELSFAPKRFEIVP